MGNFSTFFSQHGNLEIFLTFFGFELLIEKCMYVSSSFILSIFYSSLSRLTTQSSFQGT